MLSPNENNLIEGNATSEDIGKKPEKSASLKWQWLLNVQSLFLPLRNRNYTLLLSGQFISVFGDNLYVVALPWMLFASGYSAVTLGIVLAVYGIPRVVALIIGGWLSDTFGSRRVMLLADIGRAICVGILAVLAIGGHFSLWQLFLIVAPLGALSGIFMPASFALNPDLLSEQTLAAGNALSSASLQISSLLGSGLAGVIIGIARSGIAFALDAISFAFSFSTLAAMRIKRDDKALSDVKTTSEIGPLPEAPNDASTQTTTANRQSLLQILRGSQILQVSFVITLAVNLLTAGSMDVALPTLTHTVLAGGAGGYGVLLALFAAGAFVGNLSSVAFGKMQHRGIVALSLGLVQAATMILTPFTGLVGAAILLAIAGAAVGIDNVFYVTTLQQQVPRYLLGRVMSIMVFCALGLYPLSTALGGFVTQRFGASLMFVLCGVIFAAAFSYGFSQPEFRNL